MYNNNNLDYSNMYPNTVTSHKSELAAYLLWWFVGPYGIHHFYVGNIAKGIIWLLTFGCFGVGGFIDAIQFVNGSFVSNSKYIMNRDCPMWLKILGLVLYCIGIPLSILIIVCSILAATGVIQ